MSQTLSSPAETFVGAGLMLVLSVLDCWHLRRSQREQKVLLV